MYEGHTNGLKPIDVYKVTIVYVSLFVPNAKINEIYNIGCGCGNCLYVHIQRSTHNSPIDRYSFVSS